MNWIVVEFSFCDGRVLLVDPRSAKSPGEAAQIQGANRRWIERVSAIYEAHAACVRPAPW